MCVRNKLNVQVQKLKVANTLVCTVKPKNTVDLELT